MARNARVLPLDRERARVRPAGRRQSDSGRRGDDSYRAFLRDLSERLVREYEGEVPAGRVLTHVVLTAHRLRGLALDESARRDLVESSVRRRLDCAPTRPRPSVVAASWGAPAIRVS